MQRNISRVEVRRDVRGGGLLGYWQAHQDSAQVFPGGAFIFASALMILHGTIFVILSVIHRIHISFCIFLSILRRRCQRSILKILCADISV